MELFPTPENKAPANITCVEITVRGDIRLRAAFAVPDNAKGTIKGTVLVLGGRAEFIERYFEVMADMLTRGFAVATFDWRGQGGSTRLLADPLRGHISDFANYDSDIDAVYTRLLAAHCPRPYFGLAHSTGGHILLRTLRGKKWLEKAVITSPLLGLNLGTWRKPIIEAMTLGAQLTRTSWAYLPGFPRETIQNRGFENNPLTSDRRRWIASASVVELHPELSVGAPTFGWLRAAMNSIDELQRWPANQGPSCPTLIVMAGQDEVVNNEGTKRFVARVPGFSSLILADSRHEILNEKDSVREQFLAAFDAFMDV